MHTGGHLESHMGKLFKAGLALLVAASMMGPAVAQELTVEGVWQPDKSSDYEIRLCGKDDKQLCLKVLAIRDHMDKPQNRPYLGKDIIDKAKPAGKNRWRGNLNLFGQSADTTIILVSANVIELKGCLYFVACKSIKLTRAEEQAASQ